MQPRPPPPRWSPPVPQAQWVRPPPRPAFVPPFPPPARGVLGAPRFYPPPLRPPRGYFPRFVPPPRRPPPPPPPRPPVADPEQIWLERFRQTLCNSVATKKADVDGGGEPPLRLLRREVARAQKLAGQLNVAAAELAGVEKRLVPLSTDCEEGPQVGASLNAASNVEVARLRVQRERKLAVCKSLKKKLEAMNASSGLFSEQQLAVIRAFAARVNKKKAYRKRAKQQRRAEASIRRAVDRSKSKDDGVVPDNESEPMLDTALKRPEVRQDVQHAEADSRKQHQEIYLSESPRTPKQSLDPETLTIDTFIVVRRAWDSYIVFPQTPGASTIPPHFVPPPPAPSPQWSMYAAPSAKANVC